MRIVLGSNRLRASASLVRRDDRAPGRCLRALSEAHELVREAVVLKLEVTQNPGSSATHCALARWKMGRARHERCKHLAEAVAELLKDACPAEAAALRRLQQNELYVSLCCSTHLLRWTAEAIARDRTAYAFAAAEFCNVMLERLAVEEQILFPLLRARIRG